jgi:hypothetical protein
MKECVAYLGKLLLGFVTRVVALGEARVEGSVDAVCLVGKLGGRVAQGLVNVFAQSNRLCSLRLCLVDVLQCEVVPVLRKHSPAVTQMSVRGAQASILSGVRTC